MPMFRSVTTTNFTTPQQYWDGMVEPDYNDFLAQKGSLRRAYHCATSLFHMADWLWIAHKTEIRAIYGLSATTKNADEFANVLEGLSADFHLVRTTANSTKHLKMNKPSSQPNAPSSAANVQSQTIFSEGPGGFCTAPLCSGPLSGGEITVETRVVLEGAREVYFDEVATRVRQFWIDLRSQHGW